MTAKEVAGLEFNDIYDKDRNLTGRVHRRGTRWRPGEYGLVVCVWVYDGKGNILLTRRAKGKSFAGTWENSGGAAQAGGILPGTRKALALGPAGQQDIALAIIDPDTDDQAIFARTPPCPPAVDPPGQVSVFVINVIKLQAVHLLYSHSA